MSAEIMNELEHCLYINSNIVGDGLPLVATTYSIVNEMISFAHTRMDISAATSVLTDTQIAHFIKIVDFLENRSWVSNDFSVHIFNIDNNGINHYIQINNANPDIAITSSIHTAKYAVKYIPNIFDRTIISEYNRHCNNVYVDEYADNLNTNQIVRSSHECRESVQSKLMRGLKILLVILKYINNKEFIQNFTLINTVLYTVLNKLGSSKNVVKHPYRFAFTMIIECTFNSYICAFIPNSCINRSAVIFNGVMIYVNYKLITKIITRLTTKVSTVDYNKLV